MTVTGRGTYPEISDVPTIDSLGAGGNSTDGLFQPVHFTNRDTEAREEWGREWPGPIASLRLQIQPWSPGLRPSLARHCSKHQG